MPEYVWPNQRDPNGQSTSQIIGSLLGTLAGQMKQWKRDKMANDLMNQDPASGGKPVPHAEAVGVGVGQSGYSDLGALNADAHASYDGQGFGAATAADVHPFTGGEEGLKLAQMMQERARASTTQALKDNLLAAQAGALNAKSNASPASKYYHEQVGGVTVFDPATGTAKYIRPDGLPQRTDKVEYDPVEKAKWSKDLSEFAKNKEVLQKGIDHLSTLLATPGNTMARYADPGFKTGADNGPYLQVQSPTGTQLYGGTWDAWQQHPNSTPELDALRGQLAAMREPASPTPIRGAPRTAPASSPIDPQQAIAWARANPNDPRAAAILQRLGAATP